MNKFDEGYILVASNEHHYLEMAVSAACSLKYNDSRPIALLISGGVSVPKQYLSLFDVIVAFDPKPPYDGMFVRRFLLEQYSPFKRCMHIDADCLLIGSNINKFWTMFRDKPFGVMAQFHKSGKCYRDTIDVDEIVSSGISDGVYVTNWGVFFYENSGNNPVMENARILYQSMLQQTLETDASYFSRPGEMSDEPLWGIGLAQTDIDIPTHDYSGLLQLTSPSTSNHKFDYENKCFYARKGGVPQATGEIYHFAAMNPLDEYLEGIKFYRWKLGIPLPALIDATSTQLDASMWSENISDVVHKLFNKGHPSFQFSLQT